MSVNYFHNTSSINKKKTIVSRFLIAISLFLLPVCLLAQTSDRAQPITLEADSADIDDLTGISIYTGNVILTQGSMEIKAHQLTLYNDNKKQLEKAVAVGNKAKQASFKQRPEGKTTDFRARSEKMIYLIKEDKIHLLDKAFVQQAGDTFKGNKIVYNTKKETVIATSKKNKDGQPVPSSERVRVTIQPRNKTQ